MTERLDGGEPCSPSTSKPDTDVISESPDLDADLVFTRLSLTSSVSATISVPYLLLPAPTVSVEKEEPLEAREGVERADGEENIGEE